MGLCSFLCCSKCCGLLSIFGVFFLFSIGHMFSTQPMFTNVEVWEEHDGPHASTDCYVGGAIYCVTLALSVLCFVYDKKRVKRRPAIADSGASTRNLEAEALSVHPVTLAI